MIQRLPLVLLLVVAAVHAALVSQEDLSVWHVGSFGMFSRVDSGSNRVLKADVWIDAWVDLEIEDDLHSKRVKLLPRKGALNKYLLDLACQESVPEDATQVRLSLYRRVFDAARNRMSLELMWRGVTRACV